jgi:hypothetical protein
MNYWRKELCGNEVNPFTRNGQRSLIVHQGEQPKGNQIKHLQGSTTNPTETQ